MTVLLLTTSAVVFASDDISDLGGMSQGQFNDLSADLGSIVHFNQMAPAEPGGLAGFDLGVDISTTRVANGSAWRQATGGHHVSGVTMARLHARKGLPMGIDLGAFYGTSPDSNIKAWGAEVRYAILEGGVATPAVGIRGTYSRLQGVDNLKLDTSSVGASISKGFGPLTPYGGVGYVWTSSDPGASTGLSRRRAGKGEVFAGLRTGLGLFNLVLEAGRIGSSTTYSANLAFGF